MSDAREPTLFVDFLKNPSIMPLGIFLVFLFFRKQDLILLSNCVFCGANYRTVLKSSANI